MPPRITGKKRLRILVVDIRYDLAASVAYLLEIMGHEARFTFDARHVLTKVDEFRPDVAFVDIGMQSSDGVGIAQLVREYYARHELLLVAMSVYGDPKTRDARLTAAFDAHLAKPVLRQNIETVLGVLLDKRLR